MIGTNLISNFFDMRPKMNHQDRARHAVPYHTIPYPYHYHGVGSQKLEV